MSIDFPIARETPKCPYCEEDDLDETDRAYKEFEELEWLCTKCGKKYEVTIHLYYVCTKLTNEEGA